MTAQQLTMGVEEEFLLVCADGRLSRFGPEVADATSDENGELEPELKRCQVEAVSGICRTPHEVLRQLTELRGRLAAVAARRGLRLLPSGCPIVPEDAQQEITPNARYLRMAEWFGATARSVATCGCHVHVAIPDRETGVAVINRVRPWLPVLLALTANSPYDGTDTGYASWRYQEWSRWPSAGPPPVFASLDEYEATVAALLRAGALMDRAMVYWDVRLSERHPTVEFRISDVAAVPEHAVLLATLVRGLVARALDDPVAPPEWSHAVLRGNLWRAAREGLSGTALHPVTREVAPMRSQVDDLVEFVAPLLGTDLEFVKDGVAGVRDRGTGAARQRAACARRGRLTDVVDELVVPV